MAPADENRLAEIAATLDGLFASSRYLRLRSSFGRFVLRGDMAGAPALQFSVAGCGRLRRVKSTGAGG